MEGDGQYFARRAREEREAAMKAAHPKAREAHLDMAHRYDDLAGAIDSRDRGSAIQHENEQSAPATV